jgi:sulfate transport system substrate-binding protein
VLITFESEVATILRENAADSLVLVMPSLSLRADFPVAVVDSVAKRRNTGQLATAYLQFLYGETGQDILAKNHNRVTNPVVASRYQSQFPAVTLVTVDEVFGGWDKLTQAHFADGGILDQLLAAQH